jgi:hypothetical protein
MKAIDELPCENHFLETAFGDFSDGRFAWLPVDMRLLRQPIPCRGAQQLWTVRPEIVKHIEEQL